jgi:hypothetical protein
MEPEPPPARYETAYELGQRTGHTDTVVCTDCGAFVMNVAAHDRFHAWFGPILPEPVDAPGTPLPDPRRWEYRLTGAPLGFPPPVVRDEDAPPGHKPMWRQDSSCPMPWLCTTCPEVHCDPAGHPCACCRARADAPLAVPADEP